MEYTVGQLAKQSGVSVRTLHHFESLGLLKAPARSPSGYRRYGADAVLRLHRILAYRRMGLALKDIGPYLEFNAPPLLDLVKQQIGVMDAELLRLQGQRDLLLRLATLLQSSGDTEISTQLLDHMNMMQTLEKHLNDSELQQLNALKDQRSPQAHAQMRAALTELLAEFQQALARGEAAHSDTVVALARRWVQWGLPAAGLESLRQKTRAMIDIDPAVQRATGITPALKSFIDAATASLRRVGE